MERACRPKKPARHRSPENDNRRVGRWFLLIFLGARMHLSGNRANREAAVATVIAPAHVA